MDGDRGKLPKWAQQEMSRLEAERDTARRMLSRFCDAQTKSPVYVSEFDCSRGGLATIRQYIQSDSVCVGVGGVIACMRATDEGVEVRWGDDRHLSRFVPVRHMSFQTIMIPRLRDEATAAKKESKEEKTSARVRRVRS